MIVDVQRLSLDLDFFVAFSMFRIAAILQGVYARGLKGNASSTRATAMGPRAVQFAKLGWQRAERRSAG